MFKEHISILVEEVCEHIHLDAKIIVDGTAGHGGHVRAMGEYQQGRSDQKVTVFGIDKDRTMIDRLSTQQDDGKRSSDYVFVHTPYDQLHTHLPTDVLGSIDYLLLDIGINREHVVDAERGFSIKADGPLDMRFDTTKGKTAREYLLRISPEDLANDLERFGDFSPFNAQKLALHIVQNRRKSGLETTNDLKAILKDLGLGEKRCAVVYQAIRIAVNDELGHLERFLKDFPLWLAPGGRCAIITFHSIEDRMVKKAFKKLHTEGDMKLVNKKAIQPSRKEKERNRASRSAKLRIIEKIK